MTYAHSSAKAKRNDQSASKRGKAKESITTSGAPGVAATGSSGTWETAIKMLTLQVTKLAASTDSKVTATQQDLATLSSSLHQQRTPQRASHVGASRIERLQGAAPSECDDLDNATSVEGRLPGKLDRATSSEGRLIREYLPYVKGSVIESIVLETFRAEELVKMTRSFKTMRTVHKVREDDVLYLLLLQLQLEQRAAPLALPVHPPSPAAGDDLGGFAWTASILPAPQWHSHRRSEKVDASCWSRHHARSRIIAEDWSEPICSRYSALLVCTSSSCEESKDIGTMTRDLPPLAQAL